MTPLLANAVAATVLLAILGPLPACAASFGQLPYNLPRPFGVFAMASAGLFTGNGLSTTIFSNVGVSTGDIVLMMGTTPQSASASYAVSSGNTAESFSHGSVGILRSSSLSVHGDPIPTPTAAAYTDVGWVDTVTMTSAGMDGMPGQLTLGVHVEGSLFGGIPRGEATVAYMVATNKPSPELLVRVGGAAVPDGPEFSHTFFENHSVTIDFVWGQSFELVSRVVTRVGLGSIFISLQPGSISSTDFANSFYFTGIQSVTAGGNPISAYDITAASGVDYRNSFAETTPPIPEPATAYLLGSVLAVAAIIRCVKGSPK